MDDCGCVDDCDIVDMQLESNGRISQFLYNLAQSRLVRKNRVVKELQWYETKIRECERHGKTDRILIYRYHCVHSVACERAVKMTTDSLVSPDRSFRPTEGVLTSRNQLLLCSCKKDRSVLCCMVMLFLMPQRFTQFMSWLTTPCSRR